MEGGAHDLVDHIECSEAGGLNPQKPIPCREKVYFSFPGLVFPGNPISGQGIGKNRSRLVFMQLVRGKVDYVEVVFAKALQMAQVLLADSMAFAEGGSLEFTGPDLRYVMG